MCEYRYCNIRLIGRERLYDHLRRLVCRCESLGERTANQGRWVVQQHDHCAFRGSAIVRR
jgi:hypothetical protein